MDQPDQSVTGLLQQIASGESAAGSRLFELVYEELETMAHGYIVKERRRDHTWQTGDLVNETFLRMTRGNELLTPTNRRYFFFAAGRAMRQLLIEHHRQRNSQKSGGGAEHEVLDDVLKHIQATQSGDFEDLYEVLQRFVHLHPREAELIELRFFAGMTNPEIAEVTEMSLSSVEKRIRFAKAWIGEQLKSGETQ